MTSTDPNDPRTDTPVDERVLWRLRAGELRPGDVVGDDELGDGSLVRGGVVVRGADGVVRVAAPAREDYDEAVQLLYGFLELSTRWAFPKFDDEDVRQLEDMLARLRTAALAEDRLIEEIEGALYVFVVAKVGSRLLSDEVHRLLERLQFLVIALPDDLFWDVHQYFDGYGAAARARDGESGAAIIRALSRAESDFRERSRARRA